MPPLDQMAPDASPGGVSRKSGVRRVNNVPMLLLGGVVLAFMVIMGMVAMDRAAKQRETSKKQEKIDSTAMVAKSIVPNSDGGLIAAVNPPKPPDKPVVPAATPDLQPKIIPSGPQPRPADDEAQRIRMAKMQMFTEAVKSKTTVRTDAPRSSGSSGTYTGVPRTREEALNRIADVQAQVAMQHDPTTAYKERLAMVKGMMPGGGGSGGASALGGASTSSRNSMAQFNQGGQGDRWKLNSQIEAPRSPYELRAGFVVPATLISGINSDLPGQIIGQVAQDVYDTPTGKYLLIPQGSRLVGTYSSDVGYGQARILVAWQRIVFPDGKALDIGAMPGSDSAGYAGFNDRVNNHYIRLYASAVLMSGITAGLTYSQQQNQSNGYYGNPSASSAMSEALGQQLGAVTAELIRKNLSIAPTLEIRPGYRFNVVVTKDMDFSKPYESFDY